MALVKFDRSLYRNGGKTQKPGYGQIEPNQVWFNRAGMVEAQCFLDPECFSDTQVGPNVAYDAVNGYDPINPSPTANKIVAQNGAFLMIDKANKLATIPNETMSEAGYPMGINYSTERFYESNIPRREHYLTTKDWLPRIGYVEPGMRITTNTVQWATEGDADDYIDQQGLTTEDSYDVWTQIKDHIESGKKQPIYAFVTKGSDGELVIGAKPENALGNVAAQLVKAYTNADRTCSFMFQIVNMPKTTDMQES